MTRRWVVIALTAMLVASLAFTPALAQEDKDKKRDKPEWDFVAAFVHPGQTATPEEKVQADLLVKNLGRNADTFMFQVLECPKGLKAEVRGYSKAVTGIFLTEGQDRSMTFQAVREDEKKIPAGTYEFVVKTSSVGGKKDIVNRFTLTVREKTKADEPIKLTTSYPVLSGPSDAKFEFSLDVQNNSEEDKLFNLAAVAPQGWDVSFKPSYEDKQISSLQIKASQSKAVGVQVTPARKTEVGKFPLKVQVKTGTHSAEVDLTVVLTGTYNLKAGTPSGLLSLTAAAGAPANMSFYVRNDGTAVQKEVTFVSFKPENWKVEFKPEKLEGLKAGELKQVEMIITPSEQALVGDYSVGVNVNGEKTNSTLEFRVTVKASTVWGWIGVIIIVLVIIGLGVVFRTLGRR